MKLTRENNIFRITQIIISISLGLLILHSCQEKSSNDNFTGIWEIEKKKWKNGSISIIPDNERHLLELSKIQNNNIFKVDNVSGNWLVKDSLLIFENIPESKTPIDSIFVVNDSIGNSSIILQNGNQIIATITESGIIPKKVTSQMIIVSIDGNKLLLSKEGDVYIYKKK